MQGTLFELPVARPAPVMPARAAIPLAQAPDPVALEIANRIPVGLQRGRRKGWRRPPMAESVSRGTMFANPFARERLGHARGVLLFEDWLEGCLSDLKLERHGFCPAEIDALHRLRIRVHDNLWRLWRKDLVCSCPLTSRWCHRKPLLAAANEDLTAAQLFEAQRLHNESVAAARARRGRR